MELSINEEIAKLIPPLTPEEFQQLETNITQDGCLDPIVVGRVKSADETEQTFIIDGHNRYRICTKHGIHFETIEKEFSDMTAAKAWIILNQLGRRNLDVSQRSILALALDKIYSVEAKERQVEAGKKYGRGRGKVQANLPEPSQKGQARDRAAHDMKVSPRMVTMAKRVEENCIPRVIDMVYNGDLTVAAATEISDLSVHEQGILADRGLAALKKEATQIRKDKESARKHKLIQNISGDVAVWTISGANTKAKKLIKGQTEMTTWELRTFIETLEKSEGLSSGAEKAQVMAEIGKMRTAISAALLNSDRSAPFTEEDHQMLRNFRNDLHQLDSLLEGLLASVTKDLDQLDLFADCEVSG